MDEVTKWAQDQNAHWEGVVREKTIADLHECLLEVESAARKVSDSVPGDDASTLIALNDSLRHLDETRAAIDAQQKAGGRWIGSDGKAAAWVPRES